MQPARAPAELRIPHTSDSGLSCPPPPLGLGAQLDAHGQVAKENKPVTIRYR